MRWFSLTALLLTLALVAAPTVAAQEEEAAPGLSEEQLGPCRWVIQGDAKDVMADQNKLVVSTDKGDQPLDVTAESTIRDKHAKDISLSDIKPGDRIVASFHREGGQNVIGYLYQLPAKPEAAPGPGQ